MRRKKAAAEATNIAKGHGGALQRRRTRRNSWQLERHQKAFLENLAATCNVTLAARTANLTPHGGYMLRLADPVFRAAWQRALAEGRERLRDLLHERAAEGLGTLTIEGDVVSDALREYSTKLALTLLKLHEPDAEGEKTRAYGQPRPRSAEELRIVILAKLDEAAAHLGGGDAAPILAADDE